MTLRLRSARTAGSPMTAVLPMTVALAMLTACGATASGDDGTVSGSATVQTAAEESATTDATDATAASSAENAPDHDDPADHVWDEADVVDITLDGDSATSESMVAVGIDGSTITIGAPGTYRLTGALETLALSTPDVVAGQSYEVLVGGTVTGPTVGGLSLESGATGATSVGTLTAG